MSLAIAIVTSSTEYGVGTVGKRLDNEALAHRSCRGMFHAKCDGEMPYLNIVLTGTMWEEMKR